MTKLKKGLLSTRMMWFRCNLMDLHTSSIHVTLYAWFLINMENWSAVQKMTGSQKRTQIMCWLIFWKISLNHALNSGKNQVWLHQYVTRATKLFLSKVTWVNFYKKKHIPPWKYSDDNISPCKKRMFTACRS